MALAHAVADLISSNLRNGAGSLGYLWSSSLNTSNSGYAWDVTFDSSGVGRSGRSRYIGQSVRPVSD